MCSHKPPSGGGGRAGERLGSSPGVYPQIRMGSAPGDPVIYLEEIGAWLQAVGDTASCRPVTLRRLIR